MAYTTLPKLVPIGSPRITPEETTKKTITQVLQSEPVKRLLSQPNIVIKAISLTPPNQTSMHLSSSNKSNGGNTIQSKDKPDDSVTLSNSHLDDEANFLPSKNDGKSEIALLPIKRGRKKCGHYEPCENIVCDVSFQQYVDYEGSSPVLAFNIDESEINAPVTKHCDNVRCDALSIDHNRCRRAVIHLCRYDKSNICDICNVSLKTRKSRFNHKNCKRKNIYQHNDIDCAQILRERMRMRELQMITALRMKKNNYYDPLTADDKAIEILKNNSELVVIPKTTTKMPTVQPPPVVTIKSCSTQNNQNVNDHFGNIVVHNKPIAAVTQSSNYTNSLRTYQKQQQKDIQKHRQQELNKNASCKLTKVESINGDNVKSSDSQFIVTSVPQAAITYPLSMNEWVMSHTAGTTILPTQKPYLMPVRVVPIGNLKSEPPLLNQTHGIPKFCIIADNSVSAQSFINLQAISALPIQSIQTLPMTAVASPVSIPASIISVPADAKRPDEKQLPKSRKASANSKSEKKITESSLPNNLKAIRHRGHYGNRNKKRVEKKLFICTYCSKRFLTEWYFKMHIARHIGEVKATCAICDMTFTHHYDLKRHVNVEHSGKVKASRKDNDIEVVEKKEEVKQDLPMTCNNCKVVFGSNVHMEKHKCKKIISGESKNGGIVIVDSDESECNEEVEKENGIVRKKIGDVSSTIKLRKIARSQKKIVRRRVRRRKNKNKKRFDAGGGAVLGGDSTLQC